MRRKKVTEDVITCAIWGKPARDISIPGKDGKRFDSPRAGGKYEISGTAIQGVARLDENAKAKLTTWLVDQRNLDNDCPEIDTTIIDEIKSSEALAVIDRGDRLLLYIASISRHIGHEISSIYLNNPDEDVYKMLAWTESKEPDDFKELNFLFEYLKNKGWLDRFQHHSHGIKYRLSVDGYTRIYELQHLVVDSSQGFVAMWFSDEMTKARNVGLKKGILDAGYKPYIVDEDDFLETIDDKIIAEIRRSRFLVADFTQNTYKDYVQDLEENENREEAEKKEIKPQNYGARGGVYFEAGFAYGLGIPVIHTCREDSKDNLHFDIRQRPHIVWTTPEDLREKLANKISALLGDGPLKDNEID